MLRFIWNSWWRQKERFLLLIFGAIIVSVGLSYLVGISQASKGTVVDELQKRWKSSYDMVVRPPDSRSVTEDKLLLEPNYLSGLHGGISLEDYKKIKEMDEIEVAAPISMMGYVNLYTTLAEITYSEPGIYRLHVEEQTTNGVNTYHFKGNQYFVGGEWQPNPENLSDYGLTMINGKLNWPTNVLIAGIDPVAESNLVGLENALIDSTDKTNAFFTKDAKVTVKDLGEGLANTEVPVLLSSKSFVEGSTTYVIERLDLPFDTDREATLDNIKDKGSEAFLDQQDGTEIERYTFTTEEVHKKTIEAIKNPDKTGLNSFNWMAFKPTPVNYLEVDSPFKKRWPFAYQIKPYTVPEDSLLVQKDAYRPVEMFSETSDSWKRLEFDFYGVFDPSKLNISKDPLNELPMETYYPSSAKWVMDSNGAAVNPPVTMKPLNNPYGFLTKPPLLLTTLEAASEVLGDKPISSIRVKVRGVETMSEKSEKQLQEIARKIEEETGLITDITLGSSPQPAVTHIPDSGEQESIGWVEQAWIKLGSSITLFQETKMGLSGVIAGVIVVAIVYVFSSNIMMLYARKKEFAILLSIGWRPKRLAVTLLVESLLIGGLVSLLSWFVLGLIYITNDVQTTMWRFILIAVFGIVVYLFGSIIPAILVQRIPPYETMKTGELSSNKFRLFPSLSTVGMAANQMFKQWKRNLLSIIAISLPTIFFMFFMFISFHLKGIMYTTWLGEYVAIEVSVMHYIAMVVALLLAILTTTEIMWQNISERQTELAVLKALGWRNKTVQRLILFEGGFIGLIASIVGIFTAILLISVVYQKESTEVLPLLLITMIFPIAAGVIGALIPARKAVLINPSQGLGGGITNSTQTEKIFRNAVGFGGSILSLGVIVILIFAIPETNQDTVASHDTFEQNGHQGTTGELQDFSNQENDISEETDADKEELSDSTYAQEKQSAHKVVSVGQKFIDDPFQSMQVELTETPIELQATDDITKLVTLRITYHKKTDDAGMVYKPQHFHLINEKGKEFEVFHLEEISNSDWNGMEVNEIGKVVVDVTFEVPIGSEKLALIMDGDWTTGEIFVEIH